MSGNPSGRPKQGYDFAAAAKKHLPAVLEMLVASLGAKDWKERHSAGVILLDRTLGRPVQQVVSAEGGSISVMHLVAVQEIGERIVAELMQQRAPPVIDGQPVNGSTVETTPPSAVGDLAEPARE